MNNPASLMFPHLCIIRRVRDVDAFAPDPFSPETETATDEIVYSGVCRRSSSPNMRTFKTGSTTFGQVYNTDFRLSMPGRIELLPGDIADVDYGIGKDVGVTILQPSYSGLKTPLTPDGATECLYNLKDV